MHAVHPSFITEEFRDVRTDQGTFRVVRRANLIDGEVFFTAYELLAVMGSHDSYRKDETGWWGNVCERKLNAGADDSFETAWERRNAVAAFYQANRRQARRLIEKVFPEAAHGANVLGSVVLHFNERS